MKCETHKITFLPSNRTGKFAEGTTVRDAALELGIIIESDCAGIGTCGKCRVEITQGASVPTQVEEELLGIAELRRGARLACQSQISRDCQCVIRTQSGAADHKIMTQGLAGSLGLNPDIRKVAVSVEPPELGEKYFDFEKIVQALQASGCQISDYNFHPARNAAGVLQAGRYRVTAVVDRERLLALEPGDTTATLYGIAIDIGTTTIAIELLDLTSGVVVALNTAENPQRVHGIDVVSRLHYIRQDPSGLHRLNQLIIKSVDGLIESLILESGIKRDDVYKLVVAGNTVMSHIFLNIDPRQLAHKPYTPAFQGPATVTAASLGIAINPNGVVYTLPNLACFVGGDITAVLTILDLDTQDKLQLAIDMGTNGEIVLGSKDRLLCCSSPAGPAWEGACITSGMRATRGAIERAEIEDGRLSFRTVGNSEPKGICGSGLIDIVSAFLRAGAIANTGRILRPEQLESDHHDWLKAFLVSDSNGRIEIEITKVDDKKAITLTQHDIREIQLAKAAIATGVAVLMHASRASAKDISNVYIAGAFGNHIQPQDVVDLGLIPKMPPHKIKFIGNAAFTGAEAVLRSKEARERAEEIARKIEHLEIADQADLQEKFVAEMSFPVTSTTNGS